MNTNQSCFFVCIFLVFFFYPDCIFSRNFYVDPSSQSDLADGSNAHPWKTMTQVTAGTYLLVPGDSVLFRRGIRYNGRLNIWCSGTAERPIVFSAFGEGTAPEFDNAARDIITLYNRSYIVIDGFKITDSSFPPEERTQIANMTYAIIIDNSPYCTVQNCEISNAGVGIEVKKGSDYTRITGNYFHDLRMVRNTPGGDDDFGAIPIVLSSSHNVIEINRFENCWAISYDYGFEGGSVELFGEDVSDNLIIYNTSIDCNGFVELGSANNGKIVNTVIAYNKIINAGTAAVLSNEGNYKVSIGGMQFYNNVFVETRQQYAKPRYLFWMAAAASSDMLIFRNNLFWLVSGIDLINRNLKTDGIVHSNNVYFMEKGIVGFTPGKDELLTKDSSLFESSQGDPRTWDYRPAKQSVLINFGKDLGFKMDFQSAPIIDLPDAGILEYDLPVVSAFVDPVKCYGDTTMVRISASGGFPPYSGTGEFRAIAGKYFFQVEDSRGKSDTAEVNIPQPDSLAVSIEKTPVNVFGLGGSFQVSASGGLGPYAFNLNGGAFESSAFFQSLKSGNYLIGVRDQAGCITVREDSIQAFVPSEYTSNDWPALRFFPNPSQHQFELNNRSYFSNSQRIALELFSAKGERLYADNGDFGHVFRFGESLPAGTYYVRLTVGINTRTAVLVKQ